MYNIGEIEREIYRLRSMHPLIIPQIDPDKYTKDNAKIWFENVKSNDISIIAMGGSMVDNVKVQELLNLAVADYDFKILLYLTNNTGSVKGIKGKTALYWTQVPYSTNTFYTWDGLVSNSLNVSKNNLEPLPTVYVFDERESRGTANWITRSTPIPRTKPEISLAVAKAAEYLGNRFYIMAGGSGSKNPPSFSNLLPMCNASAPAANNSSA